MRPDGWMKKHLSIVTEIDDEHVSTVPVEDPFHTTNVVIRPTFWEWLRLLFRWPREIRVRVKVRSDGVSQGRWFQRAEICEHCRRTRIDDLRHPPEHDHGYHHGDERWCEACYYKYPIPSTANAMKGQS